jgi:hypothetical protein
MAKTAGVWSVTIDNASGTGKNISQDVLTVSVDTPRGMADVTSVSSSNNERLALLIDGKFSLSGIWDSDADLAHAVLSTVSSSTVTRTCVFALPGSKTLTMECLLSNYAVSMADGKTAWSCDGVLAAATAFGWT